MASGNRLRKYNIQPALGDFDKYLWNGLAISLADSANEGRFEESLDKF